MKSKYINENTASLYALYESDFNVYTRRQNLLASLALLPSEEQSCQVIFDFLKKTPKLKIDENFFMVKKINMDIFWIYAYAKQSEYFHQQLQAECLCDHCINSKETKKRLISLFLESYSIVEETYPIMFLEQKSIDVKTWQYGKNNLTIDSNFDAYFEYAIQEAELKTYYKRKNDFLHLQLSQEIQRQYQEIVLSKNHMLSVPSFFINKENADDYASYVLYYQCEQYQQRLREEKLDINALETDAHYRQLVRIFTQCYSLLPFDLYQHNQLIKQIV